jgi:hypothetical protein
MRNTSKLGVPGVAALALVLAGCASHHEPKTTVPVAAAPAPQQYPVIVRLVGRHYTVTASSGPTGVVYSAHASDGRLIVANAPLDELRRQHPGIYRQLIPGIAEHGEERNGNRRTAADAQEDGPVMMMLMSADR